MKRLVNGSMIHILEGKVLIDDVDEFLHKVKRIGVEKNMAIQAMDADKLAGKEHVRFAVEKAIISFRRGKNISNDLAKEIMLYAAGTRQISRAVKLGIHMGQNNIVLVAVGDSQTGIEFDEINSVSVLEYNDSKKEAIMKLFGITEEELEAVGEEKIPELVLERIALLEVLK
jgi:KEOPS complex subunit Cgi121